MPDDDTIRQQAQDLVTAHGEDAPIQAAERAQALLDSGDAAGSALWGRIGNMTNVLLAKAAHAAVDPLDWDSIELPSPDIKRWHVHHKAMVVTAVQRGLINIAEACTRYRITTEEFLSWKRLLDEHGLHGLRTTRLKQYRQTASSSSENSGQPVSVKPQGGGS